MSDLSCFHCKLCVAAEQWRAWRRFSSSGGGGWSGRGLAEGQRWPARVGCVWALCSRTTLHECVLQIYSTGLENFSGPVAMFSLPFCFFVLALEAPSESRTPGGFLRPTLQFSGLLNIITPLWYLAAEIRFICSCELLALTATRGLGEIRPQYWFCRCHSIAGGQVLSERTGLQWMLICFLREGERLFQKSQLKMKSDKHRIDQNYNSRL